MSDLISDCDIALCSYHPTHIYIINMYNSFLYTIQYISMTNGGLHILLVAASATFAPQCRIPNIKAVMVMGSTRSTLQFNSKIMPPTVFIFLTICPSFRQQRVSRMIRQPILSYNNVTLLQTSHKNVRNSASQYKAKPVSSRSGVIKGVSWE